jgi:hypothetical protein
VAGLEHADANVRRPALEALLIAGRAALSAHAGAIVARVEQYAAGRAILCIIRIILPGLLVILISVDRDRLEIVPRSEIRLRS